MHCRKEFKELGEFQELFAVQIARLILAAEKRKIGVRIKDAFRDPRVHGEWGYKQGYGAAKSVHKLSLAMDLRTSRAEDYHVLHDIWDELGGATRIPVDLNHFSFCFQGYW